MHTAAPGGQDLERRACRLLTEFFTGRTEAQRIACLREAFAGFARDPRAGLPTGGPPADFAGACVAHLMAFGCTDGRRHALSCLLGHIREHDFGTHPPADYVDLPPVLDALCALPSRAEELRYLQHLIAREEAKARLYSPLGGVARPQPCGGVKPKAAPWQGHKDIALLLHRPRRQRPERAADPPGEPGEASPNRSYDDILDAFEQAPQAALLGAPGAGKSTTLRRLAVDRAQRALADPRAPLPLFASLGLWTGDEDLAGFLAAQAPEIGPAAAALAQQGRLILLLDGLNEVPSARRQAKAESIAAFRAALPKGTPCILSCRHDDYVGDLRLDLDSLSLEPLSPQRVRAVLRHWLADADEAVADRLFWQLAGDERLAEVLANWLAAGASEDEFWSLSDPREQQRAYEKTSAADAALWRQHVPNPRSLLHLAANPFMLTMLYVTWADNDEALPRNRGELFAGFIDVLLSREGLIHHDPETGELHRDARAEQLLAGLAAVAMSMQIAKRLRAFTNVPGWQDFGVNTVIPRRDAARILGEETLLKHAEDATLMEPADGVQVRFRHQLLQEYFMAIGLKQNLSLGNLLADGMWPPDRWWERSGWEEATVLLAGLCGEDCTPVIQWLKDDQPEVAAQCILESGAGIADRAGLLRELQDAWLPRLTDMAREPAPEARAAIGRALGRLGLDNRKGVGLTADGLPDIDWVEIGGGAFLYQDGEACTCEPFSIARYPITWVQFQAFLDHPDGYDQDRWWAGLSGADRNPAPARWPIPNHPRETVSWHEAMAFCAWLTERLGVAAQGLAVRLPTEREWERAARGSQGRVYPWGNEYQPGHANIDETWGDSGPHHLGRTSPLGIYPQGGSPDGVLDLEGNVWEWCLDEDGYGGLEQTGQWRSWPRVVRGGSWDFDKDRARAGICSYAGPGGRGGGMGFRVLLSSPIH